jgi:hypothetical protein
VHLVRVHRQIGEPDVVRLGDRAPEPAAIDATRLEVLEETAAVLLAHGLLAADSTCPKTPCAANSSIRSLE